MYFAIFGLWKYAMETLALLAAAVPISIAIGLVIGIVAYKKKWLELALLPILSVAQTLPHFAYLIPVVVFFGIGHQTGVIATIIFAVPPMVRLTLLGLQKVSPEIVEAGKMSGCTSLQLLFRVQLPDRAERAAARRQPGHHAVPSRWWSSRRSGVRRLRASATGCCTSCSPSSLASRSRSGWRSCFSRWCLTACRGPGPRRGATTPPTCRSTGASGIRSSWWAAVAAAWLLAPHFPILDKVPRGLTITYAKTWDGLVDWIVLNWSDGLTAFRYFLIVNVLAPLRDTLLFMPYPSVLLLVAGLGLLLGGYYSALLTLGFLVFIGLAGWWDRAMITAYMVVFATFICIVVGIPAGIWSALDERRARTALFWCDTFQTFPSFIYVLPVIMLFQSERSLRHHGRHRLRDHSRDPLHGGGHPGHRAGAGGGGDDGRVQRLAAADAPAASGRDPPTSCSE